MRLRFACFCAATGLAAYAQQGKVAGPSAGYVFDPGSLSVRQVRGIAGAATLGDGIDLGMGILDAVISPRGDFAIATAADGSMHFFRLTDGAAAEISVPGTASYADAVFSPKGTAAALYRADGVQVLRGLPDAAEVAFTAPIRTELSRQPASTTRARLDTRGRTAVSDDAAVVLQSSKGAVEVMTAAGSRRLANPRGLAGIAFAPGNHDAAVVDSGTLSVYQDVTGAATRQDFPHGPAASAVGFSVDGAKVAMAGQRMVTVLDRASGTTSQASCECLIGGLAGMGSMFRLNDPGDGPVWLVDVSGAEPKLVFVPARQM